MQYTLDINTNTPKGKAALILLKELGLNPQKVNQDTINSSALGLPGQKVSQAQMRKWIAYSVADNDLPVSTLLDK